MGLRNHSRLVLHCWVFLGLWLRASCDIPDEVSVKFLKAPHAFSNMKSATFAFKVLGSNGHTCRGCTANCTLDHGVPSNCNSWKVSYGMLQDGNHTFEVCTSELQESRGTSCSKYNWSVDTIPPTAYVTSATVFTNALTVPVNITFSEPCDGGGGFRCSSLDSCNLLAYGAGQVVPNTVKVLVPNLKYSLTVSLSSKVQYGRAVVVMDKGFCTDRAGNKFSRTVNSSFWFHIDRRSTFTDLRVHVPERLIQLDSETRTVQATNSPKNLKVYLYFSEPVLNSSDEIMKSLRIGQGSFRPINGDSLGNRRFGYMVEELPDLSIATVSFKSSLVASRQGAEVSPASPVTFLYDSRKVAVSLSTTSSMRTRSKSIPVLIKFVKPVFGFNSSHILVSGGKLQNFHQQTLSVYIVEALADNETISLSIPENATQDVAGNRNLPSNVLQVRHYSVPVISFVVSMFATVSFGVTAVIAGILTVSTARLQSAGAFSRLSSSLTSHPARNLFRTACHIQLFALSRWLPVSLPVEYYELARGLRWSIPYFNLPWETGNAQQVMVGSSSPANPHSYDSKVYKPELPKSVQSNERNAYKAASVPGLPLTPTEYSSFFGSQNIIPEAVYISDPHNSNGWRDFNRSMFWLAIIGGSLILLHLLFLLILKLKKNSEKRTSYGALVLPRFEIFLIILALPCISAASAALIKGGATSGVVVGILLLGLVSFLLLALFLFLSIGITFGKLLQYKEIHQEGLKFHWYRHLVRVTLGPGKRGQWTWNDESDSVHLTMFGPLFEDLRGPPKYMLSMISHGGTPKQMGRIIASDDETEDAEAPCIQKLFGILRIYYTLIESAKRVCLGIIAGACSGNWSSKTPIIVLLSITSFQLFFIVLKKPFIKKKLQLVEIISVSCEVGIFAACYVLSESEMEIGILMVSFFLVAFLAQMMNEWYALYMQVKQLVPSGDSFLLGLKRASLGIFLLFTPEKVTKDLTNGLSVNLSGRSEQGGTTSSGDRFRSSDSGRNSESRDKPWLRQLREMAKSSFSRDGTSGDPSASRTRWSGFWSMKRSGSSSGASTADVKPRTTSLYKDLEAIFASK